LGGGEFVTVAAAEAGTYREKGTRLLIAESGIRPRRGGTAVPASRSPAVDRHLRRVQRGLGDRSSRQAIARPSVR
jgi:hypothetical protein